MISRDARSIRSFVQGGQPERVAARVFNDARMTETGEVQEEHAISATTASTDRRFSSIDSIEILVSARVRARISFFSPERTDEFDLHNRARAHAHVTESRFAQLQ